MPSWTCGNCNPLVLSSDAEEDEEHEHCRDAPPQQVKQFFEGKNFINTGGGSYEREMLVKWRNSNTKREVETGIFILV